VEDNDTGLDEGGTFGVGTEFFGAIVLVGLVDAHLVLCLFGGCFDVGNIHNVVIYYHWFIFHNYSIQYIYILYK